MTRDATPFFPITSGADTGPLLSFRNIVLFLDTKTILKQCYTISKEWNQALEDSNLWQLLLERELKLQFLPHQLTTPSSPSNNNHRTKSPSSSLNSSPTVAAVPSLKKYEWKQLYFLLTRYSRWRWRRGIERNYDVENDMKQILLLEQQQKEQEQQQDDNNAAVEKKEKVEETLDESNIPLYNNPCYFSPLIHDYQFKAMILGDKKVGKSSVMFRLLTRQAPKKEYIKKLISTEGMSQFSSLIQHTYEPNNSIQLQIYDSNIVDIGTYVKVCRMYGTFTHCVIIVFNVRSKRSYFNSINKWLPMIRKRNPNLPIFLVANKCDNFQKFHASTRFGHSATLSSSSVDSAGKENDSKRDVSREEAMEMAKEKNIIYREVSAATGEGIDELCTDLINTIFAKVVQVTPKGILDEAHETCESLSQDYNVAFKQRIIEVPKFVPTVQDRDYFEKFTESEISNESEHDEYEQDIEEDENQNHYEMHHYELEEESGTHIHGHAINQKENNQSMDDESTTSSISESEDDEKMKQLVEKSFAEADQETPYFRINVNQSLDKRQSKYYANSKALTAGLTEDNLKEISQMMAKNNVSIEGTTTPNPTSHVDSSTGADVKQEGGDEEGGIDDANKKCFIQ